MRTRAQIKTSEDDANLQPGNTCSAKISAKNDTDLRKVEQMPRNKPVENDMRTKAPHLFLYSFLFWVFSVHLLFSYIFFSEIFLSICSHIVLSGFVVAGAPVLIYFFRGFEKTQKQKKTRYENRSSGQKQKKTI
jgi:hypothetical protein